MKNKVISTISALLIAGTMTAVPLNASAVYEVGGATVFSAEEYEEEVLTYFYYENVDAQLLYDKELDSFHITFKTKKDYEDFVEYFVRIKNYATLSKVSFQYPQEKTIKAIYGDIKIRERREELEISEDGKILLNYPSNQTEEVFVIPDGIEEIGTSAFSGAANLKKVVFPETVKVIDRFAFLGCNFETIDFLPDSLEKICDGAFAYDENLKAVTIPKNVTELEAISYGPFGYCINLEEVTFERENPKMHQSPDSMHSSNDKEYFDTFYEGIGYGLGVGLGHLVYYFPDNSFDIYAGALSYDNCEFYKISMKDYKPSFSPQKQYVTGDANCDGNVNMADAVLIMQNLANPDKYGVNGTDDTHITAQGEKNGDMDGNGLTNADALEIQKQLLKISVTDTGEQALFPVVKIHTANEMSQYEEMKKNKPVVIRNEYNPLLSSASGIGILFDFYYPNNSVNLSADKGTFKTWDIEKGSGAVESVGKTYTIENEGYIFWTPDKESIFGDEKIIIHITDSKNVNLGEIVITHDENGVFSAVLN